MALSGRSPMAQPRTGGPLGVAATGQDVLMATKLHMPSPRPDHIPRPRLVETVGDGLARALILV